MQDGEDEGIWGFRLPDANAEVIVNFVGIPDGKDEVKPKKKEEEKKDDKKEDKDFIDITGLFNDAQDSVAGNAEEDDELFELDEGQYEVHTAYKLAFGNMQHGAVLTWLTDEDGRSLKKVYATEKLLLIVNPGREERPTGDTQKYKLKEDSLTVSYNAVEGGRTITKKEIVKKDKQGRYVFTIPDGLAKDTVLTVNAEFEPMDDTPAKAESHYQAAGAVAVGVLANESHMLIETGATVNAGGLVDMFGFKMNRSTTVADGTAVEAGGEKKKEEDEPTPIVKTRVGVGGAEYALRFNSNVEGAVTGTVDKKEASGATAYHPKFTLEEARAEKLDRIVISFYSKYDTSNLLKPHGTRRTVVITRSADGTYHQEGGTIGNVLFDIDDAFDVKKEGGKEILTVNLTGLSIVNGTTADVSFLFQEAEDANGSQEYLIANPIQVSYNALKNKDKSEILMGTVTYDGNHGTDGKYYFRVQPNRNSGYTIDAWDRSDVNRSKSNKDVLYASWMGADGKLQKAALKRDETCGENIWFFQPERGDAIIPDGAMITVNAVFREDLRSVRTADDFDAEKAHGSVSVSKAEAKRGDEVELTLKPDKGWVADKAQVSWFEPGSYTWKSAEKEVDRATGTVKFVIPETSDAESSYIRVTPVFAQKTITINTSKDIAIDQAFDRSLAAPMALVFSEMLETGENMKSTDWWITTLEDVLKTGLEEFTGDAWQAIETDIIKKSGSALLGSAMDMVAGKLCGKGWDPSTLKENLKETVAAAMSKFADQLVDTTINKMGDRLPILNQANVQRIIDLKAAGYNVKAKFCPAKEKEAAARVVMRELGGGQLINSAVAFNFGDGPENVYNELKDQINAKGEPYGFEEEAELEPAA